MENKNALSTLEPLTTSDTELLKEFVNKKFNLDILNNISAQSLLDYANEDGKTVYKFLKDKDNNIFYMNKLVDNEPEEISIYEIYEAINLAEENNKKKEILNNMTKTENNNIEKTNEITDTQKVLTNSQELANEYTKMVNNLPIDITKMTIDELQNYRDSIDEIKTKYKEYRSQWAKERNLKTEEDFYSYYQTHKEDYKEYRDILDTANKIEDSKNKAKSLIEQKLKEQKVNEKFNNQTKIIHSEYLKNISPLQAEQLYNLMTEKVEIDGKFHSVKDFIDVALKEKNLDTYIDYKYPKTYVLQNMTMQEIEEWKENPKHQTFNVNLTKEKAIESKLLYDYVNFIKNNQTILNENYDANIDSDNLYADEKISTLNKKENLEELKDNLKSALNEVAIPLRQIDFTRDNFTELFPRGRIETPCESVKLGSHQFEKLEAKDRKELLAAVYQTLKTPDIIIDEKRKEIDKLFGDEVEKESHIYAKSFIINDKTKAVQSIVVSIDDDNVSISTHERDVNNVVNKIKTPDQLLYVATAVRRMIEQHTQKNIEQSMVNPTRETEYVNPPNPNYNGKDILSINDLINEGKLTISNKIDNHDVIEKKGTDLSLFDKELIAYKNGELKDDHIFNLGTPSEILQKCGFAKNHRISLAANRLVFKSNLQRHKFELLDIMGLEKALQEPVAVFEYGDREKTQNVIVNIQKDGKNFLAGIHFDQRRDNITVSDIRTIFPKDNIEWLNWINQGKMIYGNKEKLQALNIQQRMNYAEVDKQVRQQLPEHCLESVDSILQSFGDVNDIFTDNYPSYAEYKKHFELEHKLYSYYTNIGNIDARELSILETEEFYNAIKNKDTNTLLEYITNEDKHECIDIFEDTLKSTISNEDFDDIIFKKIGIITELTEFSDIEVNNEINSTIDNYKRQFKENKNYFKQEIKSKFDLVIYIYNTELDNDKKENGKYSLSNIDTISKIYTNYLILEHAWQEYQSEISQSANIEENIVNIPQQESSTEQSINESSSVNSQQMTEDTKINNSQTLDLLKDFSPEIKEKLIKVLQDLPQGKNDDGSSKTYVSNIINELEKTTNSSEDYINIYLPKLAEYYIPSIFDKLEDKQSMFDYQTKEDFVFDLLKKCDVKSINNIGEVKSLDDYFEIAKQESSLVLKSGFKGGKGARKRNDALNKTKFCINEVELTDSQLEKLALIKDEIRSGNQEIADVVNNLKIYTPDITISDVDTMISEIIKLKPHKEQDLFNQNKIENTQESKKQAQNWAIDKLKDAGIEVVSDKEQFENILASKELLQKQAESLTNEQIKRYFSFNASDVNNFNISLDSWETEKLNPRKLIPIGHIPPIMKALGISDRLINIETGTISKILREEPLTENEQHGHNLTLDDVREIPNLLADPIMVFRSNTRDDSYVFFTERKDKENRSIIIPLAVEKRLNRIVINQVTSMYGRNNEFNFVKDNIENDNVVYLDTIRCFAWLNEKSQLGELESNVQFVGQRFTDLTDYTNNVLSKTRLVNFLTATQCMTLKDNITYGFTHNGKIYLNPDVINSATPIHEYTHLWDNYIQSTNAELWDKGKEAFKNTTLWQEVISDPNYQDIKDDENLVLSECHARITGKVAEKVLERIAKENGEIKRDEIIDWDKETWTYIAENFEQDIEVLESVKEFIETPMKDLMSEKNLIQAQKQENNEFDEKENLYDGNNQIKEYTHNRKEEFIKSNKPFIEVWSENSEIYYSNDKYTGGIDSFEEMQKLIENIDLDFYQKNNANKLAEKQGRNYPDVPYPDNYGYDKTDITIYNIPNTQKLPFIEGEEHTISNSDYENTIETYAKENNKNLVIPEYFNFITDRYDIGDGNGNLFNFIRANPKAIKLNKTFDDLENSLYHSKVPQHIQEDICNVFEKHIEQIAEPLTIARKEAIEKYIKFQDTQKGIIIDSVRYDKTKKDYDDSLQNIKNVYDNEIDNIIKEFTNSKLSLDENNVSFFKKEMRNFICDVKCPYKGSKIEYPKVKDYNYLDFWQDEISLFPATAELPQYISEQVELVLNENLDSKKMVEIENTQESKKQAQINVLNDKITNYVSNYDKTYYESEFNKALDDLKTLHKENPDIQLIKSETINHFFNEVAKNRFNGTYNKEKLLEITQKIFDFKLANEPNNLENLFSTEKINDKVLVDKINEYKEKIEQYDLATNRFAENPEDKIVPLEYTSPMEGLQSVLTIVNNAKEQVLKSNTIDLKDSVSENIYTDKKTTQEMAEVHKPANESTYTEQQTTVKEDENLTQEELEIAKRFIPDSQYKATLDFINNSEEKEFYTNKVKDIVNKVSNAPKLYATEGQKDHSVVLKYFNPSGTEALICEIGEDGEAFGYQVINGDYQMGEWGYIDINELKNDFAMELDYHLDENLTIEQYLNKNLKEVQVSNNDKVIKLDVINQANLEADSFVKEYTKFELKEDKDLLSYELTGEKNGTRERIKTYPVEDIKYELRKDNLSVNPFLTQESILYDFNAKISKIEEITLTQEYMEDLKFFKNCIDRKPADKNWLIDDINYLSQIQRIDDNSKKLTKEYSDKLNDVFNHLDGAISNSKALLLITVHKNTDNPRLKEAIEDIFEDVNYHAANKLLKNGEYEKAYDSCVDFSLFMDKIELIDGYYQKDDYSNDIHTVYDFIKNDTPISLTNYRISSNNIEESFTENSEILEENDGNTRILSRQTSESKDSRESNSEGSTRDNNQEFGRGINTTMGGDTRGGYSSTESNGNDRISTSIPSVQNYTSTPVNDSISDRQVSSNVEKANSNTSNENGNIDMQSEQLEKNIREPNGSTGELRDGAGIPVLTKKQMRSVREEVKSIIENKKDGEQWTSSELSLFRQYEGGGGLKEKNATIDEVLNAFYTPYPIINSVWKLTDSYAPNAITVLEPTSGIGRFADNRPYNKFTLREIDKTSSTIAKALHPDAEVIQGAFQEQFFDETQRIKLKNYECPKYDVVIGNPPYGEYENEWSGRGEGSDHTHYDQYFIEKALDSLKDENSVLAFVIPSGTLKTGANKGKYAIACKGNLIDAYRLPNKAFPTTKVGTDIVIFKKGTMDIEKLCNNHYFTNHPEKILGEVTTRTNQFGKEEEYIKIPENQTLETLLTKIDQDIKNRGVDLELIRSNQAAKNLEQLSKENKEIVENQISQETSNIEKMFDKVKYNSLELVDNYNQCLVKEKLEEKDYKDECINEKSPLNLIQEYKRRNLWFYTYYDVATKESAICYHEYPYGNYLLGNIDKNGVFIPNYTKEEFEKLSPAKQSKVYNEIRNRLEYSQLLRNNLLGIHKGNYYFKDKESYNKIMTIYSHSFKVFDSDKTQRFNDFDWKNIFIPLADFNNNIKNYSYSGLKDEEEFNRNPNSKYSPIYQPRIYYPTFESLYPENGKIDFASIIDKQNSDRITIEDEFNFDIDTYHSYDEEKVLAEQWKEKLTSLVLKDSKIKTIEEFTQKASEIEKLNLEKAEKEAENLLDLDKQKAEIEARYGSLFNDLYNLDLTKPFEEKMMHGFLVEMRLNKEQKQTDCYIDQERYFSIKEVTIDANWISLISYNNKILPESFLRNLYQKNKADGKSLTVSDISPFKEKILNIDDLIEEYKPKAPSKELVQLSNTALVEVLKNEALESEEVLTSNDNHKARIAQKGILKQVFFDNSNYIGAEYDPIIQKLLLSNEIYKLGLQNVIIEKAKELNPNISITRDFVINNTRYNDTDGKTRAAPPSNPRYNPQKEELMNDKEFVNLYGSSWKESERIFFEASGDFGNYVNLSRLTTEQINQLKNSKNYVEAYPDKFMHKEFYASGNIYNKIETLEKEFVEGKIPVELYEKNKNILQKALPIMVTDTEISILSSTIRDLEIDGKNIKEKFLDWATGSTVENSSNTHLEIEDFSCANVKREEIPQTVNWEEIYNYVNGIDLKISISKSLDEKDALQIKTQMKNDRKLAAENLFARYLKEGLTAEEKTLFWNHYNKVNNAVKSPDWSKLPLYIKGMNKFRKTQEFKLYDQQIKGISFLCNKGNGLLAYDVGVGKTAAGIVATVNQIQTGKAKRPLIIVPKTVISQWESDIHELFPDIQVNNLDNLSSKNVTQFYDGKHGLNIPENSISLVTKEALNNISFKETTRNDMLKDFQDLTGMSEVKFTSMSDREQKDYENKLRKLFGQAEKVTDGDFVFFENCGFDNITVDEAHYYKNLFKVPRTSHGSNEFQGMGSGDPAIRAMKMFVITQQIQKENRGKNVFLLTATPFTNSPSEIYSMLTYVARDEMQKQGIKNFYDFCAKYMKTQYEQVVKADGSIEYSNVIKSFNELDGLQNLLNQFIDKVDGEEAGIIRPNKHTLLAKMEATPVQREIFDFCTNVLMEYNPADDPNPDHDEEYKRKHSGMILEAINIMRTACLSPALVDATKLVNPYTGEDSGIIIPEIDDLVESSPKLKLVCDTVVKNWKENKTQGQLIFMPQGTAYYNKLIAYMEKQGIPKEVFATVDGSKATIGGKNVTITKDDDEDEQIRTKVASKFNDIENPVKILIGSDAIKEGINLNGNSIALYNCMLGWNPTDAIQAEGRIWRQGNKQGDVNIVYPLIYNSVDSLIYQKYDEKKSRIDALWEKQTDAKKVDLTEINPADLKFELIKDPYKRARIEVDKHKQEVKKELLGIENSILNFDGYIKKTEQLKEILQNRIEGKNEYIANYQQKMILGEVIRTEEEQKKGVEQREKAIEKTKNDIKNIEKKITEELNKEGKVYISETFHEEKEKEKEVLKKQLEYLDSEEYLAPIVEMYKEKLIKEANFILSEEEKNPLDKRIQANLRPAYFTEWERRNERTKKLIELELNKIDSLQRTVTPETKQEVEQEIEEINQNISHINNVNDEFKSKWQQEHGDYETALKQFKQGIKTPEKIIPKEVKNKSEEFKENSLQGNEKLNGKNEPVKKAEIVEKPKKNIPVENKPIAKPINTKEPQALELFSEAETYVSFETIKKQMEQNGYTTEFQEKYAGDKGKESLDKIRIYTKNVTTQEKSKYSIQKIVVTNETLKKLQDSSQRYSYATKELLNEYTGKMVLKALETHSEMFVTVDSLKVEKRPAPQIIVTPNRVNTYNTIPRVAVTKKRKSRSGGMEY